MEKHGLLGESFNLNCERLKGATSHFPEFPYVEKFSSLA